MSTAHRPTWAPAKGGEGQGGMRVYAPSRQMSAKDQAGQTTLKFRQPGQAAPSDVRHRDLLAELEEKERKHFRETNEGNFEVERENDLKLLEAAPGGGGTLAKGKVLVPKALDADDEDEAESDDESEDEEEDEEAELLAELERIKKERAAEAARKAAEEAASAEVSAKDELIRGNPLILGGATSFQVKRRWDDDVVFKNQTRGEAKAQKTMINDTIRNDFHRRFLNRYVK
ncbi:hypothetical protein WJX81_006631 [Elliptochloris bilobata]|uniref:Cwf15/Cwc15 cell cycle control protein n=1 Tax=Elliptochloris bilobata TaxID=381761 RepID=A0AAW1RD73_9CHLO